ncbi:sensor histidine kinase [Pedobacter cryoconitis]|uniref:sensor histidine kinase n=1 Tax=Pedobacter cryoconitis TaxID=188932 RepID=UPI001618D0B7|nr:histidine kinase [Pedobacter cryoconitis]MBB5644928.1 hypothetical protein [Pedobacter cryoconitis]
MQIFKRYSLVFYHLIFWVIYFSLSSLNEFAITHQTYFFSLSDMFFMQFPNVIIVYLSVYLFSKYTIPNKPISLIIGIFLIHIANCLVWYIVENYIDPYIIANPGPPLPKEFYDLQILTGYLTMKHLIFGFAYAFAAKMVRHEKKRNLLENERLEVEYAFLRSKINPHFLNSTVNLFYAKALPLSADLSDGIMTLSQIMRYSMDKNGNNRMVLLSDELAHVHNVIKLNQMRFSNRLQIDLNIETILPSIQIVPLIIITIVENILKHGNCTLLDDPAKIQLAISEDGHFIHLDTYNKKSDWTAEHSSGIGVENIKKRIAYHYGENYQLTIDDNDVFYSLSLKLPVFHQVEFYNTAVNPDTNENQIGWAKLLAKKKFNLS